MVGKYEMMVRGSEDYMEKRDLVLGAGGEVRSTFAGEVSFLANDELAINFSGVVLFMSQKYRRKIQGYKFIKIIE